MAVRKINITDTLETFRTQFNDMCSTDFGDIGNLDPSLSATSIIGAVNEINSVVTATAGWFIEDSTSTIQSVGAGQTLRVFGESNQISAVVSSPDTFTVGLVDAVNITTSLTSPILNSGTLQISPALITDSSGSISFNDDNLITTGNITGANITGTGTTHTLGTIQIAGNIISSIDSTQIRVNDSLHAGELNVDGLRIYSDAGYGTIKSQTVDRWITIDGKISIQDEQIVLSGATTGNNFYTTLLVTDPTANRDIVFPDAEGNVILDVSSGYADGNIFSTSSTLNIYNSSGVLQKTIVGSAS